jgi:hypothetical protein
MRGTQMARNAAVVFVLRESPFDITSYIASKKRRTQIVMMVPTKISLSAIADEVLDERLLRPPEGSVAISAIARTTRGCQYKRFSRCALRGSHRALYCYFESYCSAAPSDSSRQSLTQPITNEGWQRRGNTEVTEERATDMEPKTVIIPLAELIDRDITDQTIFLIDGYTQTAYVIEGRSARKAGDYRKPIILKRTSILNKHRAPPHTAKIMTHH